MFKVLLVGLMALCLVASAPSQGFMYHAGQNLEPGDIVLFLPSYVDTYAGEFYGISYEGGCIFGHWTYKDGALSWVRYVMQAPSHLDETRERPSIVCWANGLNFGSEVKRPIETQ